MGSGWSEYDQKLFIVKTPKFGMKSKILTKSKDIAKFKKMIDKQTKHKYNRWNMIYRSSKHGGSEQIFKRMCHDKKNIICLIKSTNGNIFGGFTSAGWIGSHGATYNSDDKAFLFLVRSSNGYKPRVFKCLNGSQALYNQTNYYCFFNGNDCSIYINQDGRTGNASQNNGTTYETYPQSYYLCGTGTFNVTELEVYQLKK